MFAHCQGGSGVEMDDSLEETGVSLDRSSKKWSVPPKRQAIISSVFEGNGVSE